MTALESVHSEFGATFTTIGPRRVVADYGKPARTSRAVRNVAGVIEHAFDVVAVRGADRVSFVDNVVTNSVRTTDGTGVYALLCDPQGKIETDCYVFSTDEQLLVLLEPHRTEWLVEEWRSKVFIDDVSISHRSDLCVFGVYGGTATEKVASVFTGPTVPASPLSFVRGSLDDIGVTVIADDYLTGEEGYFVVGTADDSERLFDILINHGLNAVPFGYTTWNTLTLEAGTPLLASELRGQVPNVAGIRNAVDFEKGCFIGQEVIARVENRGRPPRKIVGITLEDSVSAQSELTRDGESIGTITRTAESSLLQAPIGMAYVEYDTPLTAVDAGDTTGELGALALAETSQDSARCPQYEPDGHAR